MADLDQLADAWERVAAASASPMQQYAWARASVACFASGQDLQVTVVGSGGDLRAIALLVVDPRSGRLEMPGVAQLYEPMDLAYVDPEAALSLARALVQPGLPVHLPRVFADSPLLAAIRGALADKGVVICRPASACPFIPLEPDWTHPEDQLTKGRRSDLRRYRRRAEELGRVSVEVLTPRKAELNPLLEEAFRVEAAGWKGRAGSALACDAARRSFYLEYAAAACASGCLRICFLRIDGTAVAMQLALEYGRAFWLLKVGYDERVARCSPGVLLILETVRHAASRGLRRYEMLGRSEPWMRMWTDQERPCVSLRAYPYTFTGLQALVVDLARLGWRRLARRIGV